MMQKEYRARWVTAGYDRHMGSAEVVTPPSPDLLRAYYLTSSEFAISNIALGRLKVSRFSDLNDPFELLALRNSDPQVRSFTRSLREQYDQSTGLLCFSKNWISPTLWSHYAAKHRGVCLGFNVDRNTLLNVDYADERVLESRPGASGPPSASEDLLKKLSQTKFRHWEYEQETRMLIPLNTVVREGGLFFKDFGPDLSLAEVILGPLCELPLSGIRAMVSTVRPGVVVFRSRLAWNSFSVVPMESSVDW